MSDFIYESRTYNLTLQITNDGSVEEGDQWVAVHRSTKKQLTPEQLAKKFASDGGGSEEVKTFRKGAILVPPAWRRVKKTKPTKKRTSTSSNKKSKTALVLVSPEEDPLRTRVSRRPPPPPPRQVKPKKKKSPPTRRARSRLPPLDQRRTNKKGLVNGYYARQGDFDDRLQQLLAGAADMTYKMNKKDVEKRLQEGRVPMIGPLLTLACGNAESIAWSLFRICTFEDGDGRPCPYSGKQVFAIRGTEMIMSNIMSDVSMYWGGNMSTFRADLDVVQAGMTEMTERGHAIDYIVGHSLGGTCAEILANRHCISGMSFAAPGPFSTNKKYNLLQGEDDNFDYDFMAYVSEEDFVCRQPRGDLLTGGFQTANKMHIVKEVTILDPGCSHKMPEYYAAIGCPRFVEEYESERPRRTRGVAVTEPPSRARARTFVDLDAVAVSMQTPVELMSRLLDGDDDDDSLFNRKVVLREVSEDLWGDEMEPKKKSKTKKKRSKSIAVTTKATAEKQKTKKKGVTRSSSMKVKSKKKRSSII